MLYLSFKIFNCNSVENVILFLIISLLIFQRISLLFRGSFTREETYPSVKKNVSTINLSFNFGEQIEFLNHFVTAHIFIVFFWLGYLFNLIQVLYCNLKLTIFKLKNQQTSQKSRQLVTTFKIRASMRERLVVKWPTLLYPAFILGTHMKLAFNPRLVLFQTICLVKNIHVKEKCCVRLGIG